MIKISTIQGRLILLFLAFVVLISLSLLVTYRAIQDQQKDAVVLNLAGRQRMLAQQMARLALEMRLGKTESGIQALQEAQTSFQETLLALKDGGSAPYHPGEYVSLPPARDPTIREQLNQVKGTWGQFQAELNLLQENSPGTREFDSAEQRFQNIAPRLVEQADAAVSLFEAESTQKVGRLRTLQVSFFTTALALLLVGAWLTRHSVLEPLNSLGRAAERMGSGELQTAIQANGPQEVRLVAETFETMRQQLNASQEQLLAWADTLEKRVDQRTRELEALYEVSREISSRLDLQQVLHSVTLKASELLGAQVAMLCLLDERNHRLQLKAMSGPQDAAQGERTAELKGLVGSVLASRHALICGNGGCTGSCGILAPSYKSSHLAAPLWVGEQVIGALCIGSVYPGEFSEEEVALLTKLANSAAVAIENARLYAQAERVAMLEERQRIAAEMHDGLGQTLSYLGLSIDQVCDLLESGQELQATEKLEHSRQVINRAVDEVRLAIAQLVEKGSAQRSLQERLQSLIDDLAQEPGVLVEWQAQYPKPLFLERDDVEQVVQVAREAILNAWRHANASRISLRFDFQNDQACLDVEDDGTGFDPGHSPEDGRQHFGLQVMHARAAQLGGVLQVNSVAGQGTQVRLIWPLQTAQLVQV